MTSTGKTWMIVFLVGVLLVGVLLIPVRVSSVQAEAEGKKAAPAAAARYSVVETEGHNLLVTDNGKNMLYFYTVDKDKPIGSELKLRGTIDLTQVGKPTIKPVTIKKEEAPE